MSVNAFVTLPIFYGSIFTAVEPYSGVYYPARHCAVFIAGTLRFDVILKSKRESLFAFEFKITARLEVLESRTLLWCKVVSYSSAGADVRSCRRLIVR